MKQKVILLAMALFLLGAAACSSTDSPADTSTADSAAVGESYTVDIDPAGFVEGIDNPYFPRVPGSTYVYEGETEDGLERTVVEVLAEPKVVMGVTATVVRDTVFLDGEMIEDTYDWFAQDNEGNVWYFGEDVDNYEDGELVDHGGAWEAGVDGALPGIIMYADPAAHVGEPYRQEYYVGVAEDMGEILSLDEQVTVPYGSFEGVLETRDWTPLEPGVSENKFYARDLGVIKELDAGTGEEAVLIKFTSK